MLKKELLEMCFLHLLSQKELYGYELLRRLHLAFPDAQESALYAILRGLHQEGRIELAGSKSEGGPPRKYYRLTQCGRESLECLLSTWRALQSELQKLGIS